MFVPDSCLTTKASVDDIYFLMGRIYDLTLFTYLFAFAHFSSELLIFRTASFGALSPVIVSSESAMLGSATRGSDPSDRVITVAVSLTWMIMQYDFYVQ